MAEVGVADGAAGLGADHAWTALNPDQLLLDGVSDRRRWQSCAILVGHDEDCTCHAATPRPSSSLNTVDVAAVIDTCPVRVDRNALTASEPGITVQQILEAADLRGAA
jgi:hypothetical protein